MSSRRPPGPTTVLDLTPAATRLADLVATTTDDDLTRPTPCEGLTVGQLLDHIAQLAVRLADSARKVPVGPGPTPDAANLVTDWRTRIPADLHGLAAAWAEPDAWDGDTTAGSVPLTAEAAGLVTLDELLVHGWDLAVATGRTLDMDDADVAAATGLVRELAGDGQGRPGLFGPAVATADDAPPAHRLLGLTGRDPAWTP